MLQSAAKKRQILQNADLKRVEAISSFFTCFQFLQRTAEEEGDVCFLPSSDAALRVIMKEFTSPERWQECEKLDE